LRGKGAVDDDGVASCALLPGLMCRCRTVVMVRRLASKVESRVEVEWATGSGALEACGDPWSRRYDDDGSLSQDAVRAKVESAEGRWRWRWRCRWRA
jgi:hypothetical protein